MNTQEITATSFDFFWTLYEKEVFSEVQIQICNDVLIGLEDVTINEKYRLKSKGNISTCVNNAIRGNYWEPGKLCGGSDGYFSDVDRVKFIQIVHERSSEMDCIKTIEAVKIAMDIKEQRYLRAQYLISKLSRTSQISPKKRQILREQEPYCPSDSWLTHFCESNEIKLQSPILLEQARRRFCNVSTVTSFYTNHRNILTSTPRNMIWNADETSAESSRKYKVLLDQHAFPICPHSKYSDRVTTVLTVSANGEKMDPFLIIPGVKKLPDELSNIEYTICSQKNGWMTQKLWLAYIIYFTHNIQKLRLDMSFSDSKKTVLLIVDNHNSRINSFALEYLYANNINLLTLPSHCTHVLQPIDVAVASCYKSHLNRSKINFKNFSQINQLTTVAAKARLLLIYSIKQAWDNVCSEVIKSSFEKTGIYPFDPTKGISNKFTNQTIQNLGNIQTNRLDISNQLLTSTNARLTIANRCYCGTLFNYTNEVPKLQPREIHTFFASSTISQGFILNKLPCLIVQTLPNVYVKLFY